MKSKYPRKLLKGEEHDETSAWAGQINQRQASIRRKPLYFYNLKSYTELYRNLFYRDLNVEQKSHHKITHPPQYPQTEYIFQE
jgi:hypothetical protein